MNENHAYLVVSDNLEKAKTYIGKLVDQFIPDWSQHPNQPDLIQIQVQAEKRLIGIDIVKELKNKLALKPYQTKTKVAVIWQAEKLTVEAQNALLKLLEEPPNSSVLILQSGNYQLLLPTIISRCQLTFLGNKLITLDQQQLEEGIKLTNLSLAQKFALADKMAAAPDDFLTNYALIWRQFLLIKLGVVKVKNADLKRRLGKLPLNRLSQFIKEIQLTRQLIDENVNPRFALEILLLASPQY